MPSENYKVVVDIVYVSSSLQPKRHIRIPGEDVQIGQQVLEQGTPHLGVLNALQIEKVEVFQRLRVGLMSSGDELQEAAGP